MEVPCYKADYGECIGEEFIIYNTLGKGTFGNVYKCLNSINNNVYAIKITHNDKKYISLSLNEIKLLKYIKRMQRKQIKNKLIEREYCVNFYKEFYEDIWHCIACESLGPSLYDVLRMNNLEGMPFNVVMNIAYQLIQALIFLKSVNIVHADLKLENILFINNNNKIYKNDELSQFEFNSKFNSKINKKLYLEYILPEDINIKIIDFGCSKLIRNTKKNTGLITTQPYRSPEALLNMNWSFPTDMWSAGCIIAELWTGSLLFNTEDDTEHLIMMNKLLGSFPKIMEEKILYSIPDIYFENSQLYLNGLDIYQEKKINKILTINNLMEVYGNTSLTNLLEDMLCLDPDCRIQPEDCILNLSL
jgi:serine/threonine protein kinase